MNKRIVELHNQTMYWVADNGGLRISDRIPTGYTEKFAELIVQECINEIHGANVSDLVGKSYYLDLVAEHIEKHFGVEA